MSSIETRRQMVEQAEHFGDINRLSQLMEECAELIAAASRYKRKLSGDKTLRAEYSKEKLRADVEEEMADVTLLLHECRHLLDISSEDIARRIEYKLKRTEGLM